MKRFLLLLSVSAVAVGVVAALPASSGAVICKLKGGNKVKCPTAELAGPIGPAGPPGPQGPAGPNGLPGGGGAGSLPAAAVARTAAQGTLNTLGLEVSTADAVQQITLPTANWVVNAQATFGSNSGADHYISCSLLDGNNPLSSANTHTTPLLRFSATASLVGISDGGVVTLACATDPANASVRERIIVATQVGTVTGP